MSKKIFNEIYIKLEELKKEARKKGAFADWKFAERSVKDLEIEINTKNKKDDV